MEIDITRAIILGVVTLAAFSLGFMSGNAYSRRKYNLTRKEIKRLQKQNELMKKLSPKLKWGEDEKKADYLPEKLDDVASPKEEEEFKPCEEPKWVPKPEDDDTKTGEMVRDTKGHPDDA